MHPPQDQDLSCIPAIEWQWVITDGVLPKRPYLMRRVSQYNRIAKSRARSLFLHVLYCTYGCSILLLLGLAAGHSFNYMSYDLACYVR